MMQPKSILAVNEHRPWPLPTRPWIMAQSWEQLLFAHWPVEPDILKPLIPAALDLDIFEGQAWISVVPFWVTGARPRWMPPIPPFSRFLETNVRTYVTVGGDKPGVLFFSLDASNPVVVAAARIGYWLPYIYARMAGQRSGNHVSYRVRRGNNTFQADYQPSGLDFVAQPGTLDYWLVERYCLYTTNPRGKLRRGDIHHLPWQLWKAEATLRENDLAPIPLSKFPTLLHYVERQDTLIWPLTAG